MIVLAPGHQSSKFILAADEADYLAPRIKQPYPAFGGRLLNGVPP
jgi:hypothetical protein